MLIACLPPYVLAGLIEKVGRSKGAVLGVPGLAGKPCVSMQLPWPRSGSWTPLVRRVCVCKCGCALCVCECVSVNVSVQAGECKWGRVRAGVGVILQV